MDDQCVEGESVRLRRISRPRLLILFAIIVVIVAAGSFVAGHLLTGTASSVEEANQVTVPVTARVETRSVTESASVQGTVSAGQQLAVTPSAPEGTTAPVVVAVAQSVGSTVTSGSLLGVVSNRPVFLLQSPIPFFRDLSLNDTGADVTALQGALNQGGLSTPVSGKVTNATLSAVKSMYKRAGFALPGGTSSTTIDVQEFATMNSASPTVISEASIGETLSAQTPLMTLQLSPDVVTARVNELQHNSFPVGAAVKVSASAGHDGTGKVVAVSGFQATSDAQPIAGYDIQISFDDPKAAPSVSSPVVVTAIAAAAPSLAVPLIAVRQDSHGAYVVVKESGKKSRRADVTITARADGWAAVTGGIEAGQQVSVR